MSGCTDKRLGAKLYAYELGMLDEAQQQEIEIHLLECPYCLQRALELQDAAELLRGDSAVREQIATLSASDETQSATQEEEIPTRKRFRPWIPIGVAAALLLVFLILKPWRLEFEPTKLAVATERRLAVMYFDNLADRQDSKGLGEIATNLLITDLAESEYFDVVSSERIYDILKLLGREGQKQINREVSSEVAAEAKADWLLSGSILQVEPTLVLTSQLIETRSGKVLATQRVDGMAGETIFSLIDKLTAIIRRELPLPAVAQTELDRPIAEVTTHSPEAYRHYIAGIELLNKYYHTEAKGSFVRALECDSTFAMTYYHLADLLDRELIDKAMLYVERASRRDGYFIRSRKAAFSGNAEQAIGELLELLKHYPDEKEAYYLLGSYEYSMRHFTEAIGYLEKAIQIDPLYKNAYNLLAYADEAAGDFDEAMAAINKYISLVPGEANPYDTRGDLYASQNMIDSAISSYQMALAVKPDYYISRVKLGELFLFKRQFPEAEKEFRQLTAGADVQFRASGRSYLALLKLFECELEQSLHLLDQCIAADSVEPIADRENAVIAKLFIKSRIHLALGDSATALVEIKAVVEAYTRLSPRDMVSYRSWLIEQLTAVGKYDEAQGLIDQLDSVSERSVAAKGLYFYGLGHLALAQGNIDSALTYFRQSKELSRDFYSLYGYSRLLLRVGRTGDAIAEFEKLLNGKDYWLPCYVIDFADAHYYLGQAYEVAGDAAKAIAAYESYLAFWRSPYDNRQGVRDAKTRLEKLKQRT